MEPLNTSSLWPNATNHSTSPSPDPQSSLTTLQIITLIIFASTSLIGLAAYILVLAVLYLHFKEFKSNFYYLVISLSFVDMGFLLMVVVYMVPSTILQRNILPQSILPGFVSAYCFLTGCTHLAFIGIHRLITVSLPRSMSHIAEKYLNNKWFVIASSIVFWLVGPSADLVLLYVQHCILFYDEKYMAFSMMICDEQASVGVDAASLGVLIASWFVPCSIAASHLLTWVVIYAKGAGMTHEIQRKRKRERALLIQFTLISMAALLYDSSFWFVPKVFSNHPEGFVLITLFGIASTAVNPFMYLIYNTLMKKKAKYLVFVVLLRRPNNAVTSVGTTHPLQQIANVNGGQSRRK